MAAPDGGAVGVPGSGVVFRSEGQSTETARQPPRKKDPQKDANEMADRYLIASKTARWQSGCRCSTCGSTGGLRCGVRKRRSSLVLGGLKYALPGWEEAESRCAADTAAEASWRSHASGAGNGGGLDDGGWGAGHGGDVGHVDRQ
jgi:hypothetical protein